MHRYYLTQRPPMPGAMPSGWTKCRNFGEKMQIYKDTADGRDIEPLCRAWGWVEYDTPLTAQQIRDYELVEKPFEV